MVDLLNRSRLLTLKLDTPEAWLVTPVDAYYDLDNIRLQDISVSPFHDISLMFGRRGC